MSLAAQPIDKENSSVNLNHIKNQKSFNQNDNNKKKNKNDGENEPVKRRPLGNVMNIKQQHSINVQHNKLLKSSNDENNSISCGNNNSNSNGSRQSLKPKQQQRQQENDLVEEIEFTHTFSDNFNDILNERQKLSTLMLNQKYVALLPTHSIGEFSIYNDNFHSMNTLSDKKVKKDFKKSAKLIQKQVTEMLTKISSIDDIDLFVPPNDW